MLKKVKLSNSTIILTGILIIGIGICIGFYEYFEERKNKTFSEMNLMLYDNETPESIIDEVYSVEQQTSNTKEEEKKEEQNKQPINYNYTGILEIPKINVKRGFYNLNSGYNNVDYNVTMINGSTMPDEENSNLILAAHSGDCPVCYFEKLYKLKIDDEAYVTFKNVKYKYKIVDIYEVEKDGTVAIHRNYEKKCLTLITCTRNSNTKQTVYILEIIE